MTLHKLFFYLTIVLLPTQLGYHFWPDWAIVLGRRVDYLAPTIFLTDITILLTLVSLFISKVIRNKREAVSKKSKIIPHTSYLIPQISNIFKRRSILIALLLFIGLNIYSAVSPFVAFNKWIKVIEFLLFGIYIIKTKPSLLARRSLGEGGPLVSCLLIFSVLYSSIIAITQFIFQHSLGGIFWFLGERTFTIDTPGIARSFFPPAIFGLQSKEVLRAYGTFPHPNVLGGFLAVTLPLIIGCTDNQINGLNNKLINLFRQITIFLGIIALFVTFSRSAWTVGGIGIIIALFINCKLKIKNLLKIEIIGIGMCLICVSFLSLQYFRDLTPTSESVLYRDDLVKASISMWLNTCSSLQYTSVFLSPASCFLSLLFGIGLGNFLPKLPEFLSSRQIFFLQPVHNIYLLTLSETGIVGLMIFLYIIYRIIRRKICLLQPRSPATLQHQNLTTLLHRNPALSSPRIIVFLSLISFLLLGFIDHYPLTLQQGQLILTLLISFSIL